MLNYLINSLNLPSFFSFPVLCLSLMSCPGLGDVGFSNIILEMCLIFFLPLFRLSLSSCPRMGDDEFSKKRLKFNAFPLLWLTSSPGMGIAEFSHKCLKFISFSVSFCFVCC